MKVSVVMYRPPEDESLPLGVIKGASLAKAKKLALTELNDHDDVQARLIPSEYSKSELAVEERYLEDDDEWTKWEESGAVVWLDTHTLVD